jgi:hypothetical protein
LEQLGISQSVGPHAFKLELTAALFKSLSPAKPPYQQPSEAFRPKADVFKQLSQTPKI